MRPGDLVMICRSPWNINSMFGYKNGDLALVLEWHPDPSQISLPSVRVLIFRTGREVTIPTMYAKNIGE